MEQNFAELGLSPALLRILNEIGYVTPTKIQMECFSPILNGLDVVGQSQTGTGKTAAFALPMLQGLEPNRKTQILVVCPTRELAEQIHDHFKVFVKYVEGVRCISIFGGQRIDPQIMILKKGMSVVIGTPGRILDHLQRRTLKLNNLKTLVLDEADEMLKMGFKEDIEKILKACPKRKQTLLFSATIPNDIKDIIDSFLIDPTYIEIEKEVKTANVEQYFIRTKKISKEEALLSFIKQNEVNKAIIFSNTKVYSSKINEFLLENGIESVVLNGDMKQRDRKTALEALKNGKVSFLVATDIAARGIDVSDIDYIINYDLPSNSEQYVHRIGRTARAGKNGVSLTLINTARQAKMFVQLQKELEIEVKEWSLDGIESPLRESKRRDKSSSDKPKRDYDKPRKRFDDKPKRDYDDKPKRDYDDKPRKRFDDKPKWESDGESNSRRWGRKSDDAPKKRYDDKPKRDYDDKPRKRFDDKPKWESDGESNSRHWGRKSDDAPKKRYDDKPKRDYDDKPRKRFGDKPKWESDGESNSRRWGRKSDDAPKKRYDDKPKRDYSDKPKRNNNDKPKRDYGDKPRKRFDDKPKRDYSDKPKRSYNDKPSRGNSASNDYSRSKKNKDKPKQGYSSAPEKPRKTKEEKAFIKFMKKKGRRIN